jgi:long-chain fatty acid transport protein
MAGSGTALYLTPLSVATNPASSAFLGKQLDFGVTLFNPNREYSVNGTPSGFPGTFGLAPGTIESDSKLFAIPEFGFNLPFGEGNAFTIAMYANGGMNTNYLAPTFGFEPTGVNLEQLFVNLTYGKKLHSNHSIGVSGIFAYQKFRAEGLTSFAPFSSQPSRLSNNGNDSASGAGAKFGYLGEWAECFSFGASYQSKIYMGRFENYAGLFAEQGDFDIPANWNVGVAVRATPTLTLSGDVQGILYSGVKSINNPLLPNLQTALLGNDNGAGFGWEDVTVLKLGTQWTASPNVTVRGGYSYGSQPIPSSEMLFNIIAPGVIKQHITFGVAAKLSSRLTLNLGFMHGLSNTESGPNPLEAPSQQTIGLKMNQFEGDIGLSISF